MGATVVIIALSYVAVSTILMHMKHDLLWEQHGSGAADRCQSTCENSPGLETCIDRGVPPASLLCHSVERLGTLRVSRFSCECPAQPLLLCDLHNSTALWTTRETGTCKLDQPVGIWLISVVLAGLVALHGILSCFLCGCHSKREAGCGPWSLARMALGSGVAGPTGIAASRAMALV
jgi:hypothetical protein